MSTNRPPRDRRVGVKLRAKLVTGDGQTVDALVLDLSHAGFRAQCPEELFEGEQIQLELGRSGFVLAEVLWCMGGGFGARFHNIRED